MLDGNLSLITPEGIRLRLTPAGPTVRAFAWVIDLCVWLGMVIGISMLSALMTSIIGDSKTTSGFVLIALFTSYWGYPVLCEVYWRGATVGKRAMGIKVVRSDGLPVGWRESVLRNLLLVADFLPMLYVTGLICMLSDTRFRRLGDWVAGTQVIYVEKVSQRGVSNTTPPQPLPFALTPQQQSALVDLFEREPNLPIARLIELGTIAQPLTQRQGEESVKQMRAYVAGILQ
jgi:uncharacterized RDD family membrane protein YckC